MFESVSDLEIPGTLEDIFSVFHFQIVTDVHLVKLPILLLNLKCKKTSRLYIYILQLTVYW